jgi:hypothetical protein
MIKWGVHLGGKYDSVSFLSTDTSQYADNFLSAAACSVGQAVARIEDLSDIYTFAGGVQG